MKKTFVLLMGLCRAFSALAQIELKKEKPVSTIDSIRPIKVWDKSFGGDGNDVLTKIISTTDGNFLLAGLTDSGISGDKTKESNGHYDYWIVKMDNIGHKIWDRSFGGSAYDHLSDVIALKNGGYLLAGTSHSPPSGNKTSIKRGISDFWVIKLDANGKKLWDKGYGGHDNDALKCALPANDGGFLLGGDSDSNISGSKTQASCGANDFWVVKTDANGNKLWDKRFGGSGYEQLRAMVVTDDGGYLLGGYTSSDISGDITEKPHGDAEFWLIKIDSKGKKLWDKRYGGIKNEAIYAIIKTNDGGYLLGGTSESGISGDKTQTALGETDYWIVKTDANGQKQWDRSFGGNASDGLAMMIQDTDNCYVLGGYSASGISDDKTTEPSGYADYWLIKTDVYGNKLWDKQLGGNDFDTPFAIQKTADGGYLSGGHSTSGISGEKSENSKGGNDFWIVKIK